MKMGNMVDVIFYMDRISPQNIIDGYKNIKNIPTVGEHVIVNENCYEVTERVFDFDFNTLHITLNPSKRRFIR